MRQYKKIKTLILLTAGCICLFGCGTAVSYDKAPLSSFVEVKDKDSLYEDPIDEPVLYLTVGKNEGGKKQKHSWTDINSRSLSWYEENDEKPYECDALVQFGNEEGPTSKGFGFGDFSANATVRLSGMRASEKQQKSYRIRLYTDSGSISGIRTLVLSKSFKDPLRFTNKLCFDLLTETEGMLSVRSQFVHLYVKDESEGQKSLFEDYGLYTMTETINKKYLKNRDMDDSGELYKIENFDFDRHADSIMLPTDADYDDSNPVKARFKEYGVDMPEIVNWKWPKK